MAPQMRADSFFQINDGSEQESEWLTNRNDQPSISKARTSYTDDEDVDSLLCPSKRRRIGISQVKTEFIDEE